MEEKKKRKISSRVLMLWVIVAILLVLGATYAWFSFNTVTNVDPNTAGTISDQGDGGDLLIANNYNGPYGTVCDLAFISHGGDLQPLSTSDLSNFYKAGAQNTSGITVLYSEANDIVDDCTMHGSLYLKTGSGSQDLYLYKDNMTFGNDVQAMAAMRLGIKVSDSNGVHTYIFRLDDMADLSSAESRETTKESNVVVQSISSGAPNYVGDVALGIDDYSAVKDGSTIKAGRNKIGTVKSGDIVTVEFWLYLEGCDKHCFNKVQNRDVSFAMAFAGTQAR